MTPDEARLHDTNASRLAEEWGSKIRDALSLPPLKYSEDFLRLPLGSSKTIGLVGSLAFASTVSSTNDSVVRIQRTDAGILIRCVGIGDAGIQAISGNSMRTLAVNVRPYAGVLPQSFVVEVTGSPASESTVEGAIEGCLKARVVSLPTATCTFLPVGGRPLAPGASVSYAVHARLRAPGAFDGVGNVMVTVRNIALDRIPDSELWYSNAPESVHQVGPLFSSSLKRGSAVRLLYHHINMSTQPMIIRVEAVNDTDLSAKIAIAPGDASPDKNPVRAGLDAAAQYLRAWSSGTAQVETIPARSTFPISLHLISPKETVSGLCSIRLIDGPPEVQVRADALPPFDLRGAWYDASLSSMPWQEVGTHPINDYDRALSEPSQNVFPNPYRDDRMDYTLGGRYAVVALGQKPIAGEDHINNLDGNFGVLYRIKATIKNPTSASADVDLMFEANTGYTGGLFILDGNLIRTPLLTPKNEMRLGRYRVSPGGERSFDIVTVPLSGGTYPATLSLRPAENSGAGK